MTNKGAAVTVPLRMTKRARIILLLQTRQDALEAEDDPQGGEIGSRSPRYSSLWREGSYRELELCLDYMARRSPRIRWHLINCYQKREHAKAGLQPKQAIADKGLDWLERVLRNVYVPQSISENAGYTTTEAQTYAKPRSFRRAA